MLIEAASDYPSTWTAIQAIAPKLRSRGLRRYGKSKITQSTLKKLTTCTSRSTLSEPIKQHSYSYK